MKGLYLTQETKDYFEQEVNAVYKVVAHREASSMRDYYLGRISVLKELVYFSTVLPVYKSWGDVEAFPPDNESQKEKVLELQNGVVIEPKE